MSSNPFNSVSEHLRASIVTMNLPFDYCADRPEHIETILNGLDRYNPETTAVFQDYVQQQCDDQTYDCYANLALLKLCVQSDAHPRISSLLAIPTMMIEYSTFPIT